MSLALFGLLTSNGKKQRERERKQKETENEKKRTLGTSSFFTEIMWGHGIDVLMVLKTHLMLKSKTKQNNKMVFCQPLRYIKWSRREGYAGLFSTRSRLVISSRCPVYLEARNNSNCNCIIGEGLGYKEYEYRTESYAGMITWLIPWLVVNDRFYLIKRRALRLDEIGQTFQSSGYASLVWRRTQDALCNQTNYLSYVVRLSRCINLL